MKRVLYFLAIGSLGYLIFGCQAEQGIEKLQREVWKNPNNTRALFKLGMAYGSIEDYENASKTLTKLILIDSTHTLAYSALGAAYFKMEKYNQATEAFQKVIVLDSTKADYHFDLANAYFQLKKYQKASLTYEHVLKLDSAQTDTYYNLGLCYGYMGNQAKAKAILKKLAPINAYLSVNLERKLKDMFENNSSDQNQN